MAGVPADKVGMFLAHHLPEDSEAKDRIFSVVSQEEREELLTDDGFNKYFALLNRWYGKTDLVSGYQCIDEFFSYRKKDGITMDKYITESSKKLRALEKFVALPKYVSGIMLLRNSGLYENDRILALTGHTRLEGVEKLL